MSSSNTAADPPNTPAVDAGGGTLSTPENVEPVHSSSSKVEVVGDAGVPVIESAAVYRNGEVVDVDCTIVNAVDSFEVPAGHVRKGARERYFMYSVGVYAEKIDADKTKKKSWSILLHGELQLPADAQSYPLQRR